MLYSTCLLLQKVAIETVRNFACSEMVTLNQVYDYEKLRQWLQVWW